MEMIAAARYEQPAGVALVPPAQVTVPPKALQLPLQVNEQVPERHVKREPAAPLITQLVPWQSTVAAPLQLPVQDVLPSQLRLQSPLNEPKAQVSPDGQVQLFP